MKEYFLRRMILIVPTFLGITLITFLILQAVPGGPLEIELQKFRGNSSDEGHLTSHSSNIVIPESALNELKKFYEFDKPIFERYVSWLTNLIKLNFGNSYVYGEPVLNVISSRLPVSIYFGLTGFILTYLICIPIGVLKAVNHKKSFDLISSVVVFMGYSLPGWVFGTLSLLLFSSSNFLDILPLGGMLSENFNELDFTDKLLDLFKHSVLPVAAYLIGSVATLVILTKNSVLENIKMDYVRTAAAKGISRKNIILKHVFRNSLIPLSTGLGHFFSLILTGSFLIETVFNIKGIGLLGYNSLIQRDYPVIMGLLVFSSILLLLGNVFSDLLYAIIDPRIRFKAKR